MDIRKSHEIFPHKCRTPGCGITVQHDDEPWCATHSPTDEKCVPGYSAKAEAETLVKKNTEALDEELTAPGKQIRRNIFNKER